VPNAGARLYSTKCNAISGVEAGATQKSVTNAAMSRRLSDLLSPPARLPCLCQQAPPCLPVCCSLPGLEEETANSSNAVRVAPRLRRNAAPPRGTINQAGDANTRRRNCHVGAFYAARGAMARAVAMQAEDGFAGKSVQKEEIAR